MINRIALIAALLGLSSTTVAATESKCALDYEHMIHLDAEELAETGIKAAYEKLKPQFGKFIPNPATLIEFVDNELSSYSVSSSGVIYEIYSPSSPNTENESWGKATFALFSIINSQLKNSKVKFYAINGGNDLGGIFLTPQQVSDAKHTLKRKTDWPYIPTLEHPWYGQFH